MALPENTVRNLYRRILFIRLCEEKIRSEYSGDEMKTPVHLSVGAEAIAAGVIEALPPASKVFGTYRNHAIYLALTGECEQFFAELYGKKTGCAAGKAGSMHMTAPEKGLVLTSAVVSTTIPVAVGAALANQYAGNDGVVAVFFGDGAVEEGAFWESLNFACARQLRVLFVCEDNDLAIHTPAAGRQGFHSMLQAAAGFKCYVASARGHRPVEVYQAAADVIKKMKGDPMPAFCHFPYFRYLSHVGVDEDFNAGYRSRPSADWLAEYDPLVRAGEMAGESGMTGGEMRLMEEELTAQIDLAVRNAKAAPLPGAGDLCLK
jgi:TPP-dependent pyruvate/acetoin dehydrogenase alpha subunit